MDSVSELRKAAETLRGRAAVATAGPWLPFRAHARRGPDCIGVTTDMDVDYDADIFSDQLAGESDATYIATMHPGVGLALADVLDETAETWRIMGAPEFSADEYSEFVHLARLINGDAQ